MKRRWIIVGMLGLLAGRAGAQTDPGKDVIGTVTATVYYATNGDPAAAGPRAKAVSAEVAERLAGGSLSVGARCSSVGCDR